MDSDQQEQQQTTQPQSIPGGEGVEKERTTPQMNRFRLSNDAEGEDSPKKSFAFWQSQEQDAIRSRSSSLSRTPNQMGRSPSFSSKVKVIDPQQVAALLDSTNSTTSTTSLTSSLNTSTHAKDQEQRFNKLASLTGRKDSLASLQPYLNPKTQEGNAFDVVGFLFLDFLVFPSNFFQMLKQRSKKLFWKNLILFSFKY